MDFKNPSKEKEERFKNKRLDETIEKKSFHENSLALVGKNIMENNENSRISNVSYNSRVKSRNHSICGEPVKTILGADTSLHTALSLKPNSSLEYIKDMEISQMKMNEIADIGVSRIKNTPVNDSPNERITKEEINSGEPEEINKKDDKIISNQINSKSHFVEKTNSNNVLKNENGQIIHFTSNTLNNYMIINNISNINSHEVSLITSPDESLFSQNTINGKKRKSALKCQEDMLSFFTGKKKVLFTNQDIRNTQSEETNTEKMKKLEDCNAISPINQRKPSIIEDGFMFSGLIPSEDENKAKKKLSALNFGERKESVYSNASMKQLNDQKKEELKLALEDSRNKKVIYDKACGCISGFSAYTFKNFKKTNEDKLSICINLKLILPSNETANAHFFAIYDGHGGENVAEMLKNNLHQLIIADKNFISNPTHCIKKAFEKMEKHLTDLNKPESHTKYEIEPSGSCAIVLMTINKLIILANLGDSRGIISQSLGNRIFALSIDHKPSLEGEKQRIENAGGKVCFNENSGSTPSRKTSIILRVYPGGLAVSRSIGDLEVKIPEFGGKPGMISAEPDIVTFETRSDMDFILIGSDGIFDKLSNKDITLIVLSCVKESITDGLSFRSMLEKTLVTLMKEAIERDSKDNITCVFLCMDNLLKIFNERNIIKLSECIEQLKESTLEFDTLYTDNFFSKRTFTNVQGLKKCTSLMKKSTILTNNIEFQEEKDENTNSHHTKAQSEAKSKQTKVNKSFCCGIFSNY